MFSMSVGKRSLSQILLILLTFNSKKSSKSKLFLVIRGENYPLFQIPYHPCLQGDSSSGNGFGRMGKGQVP